MIAEKISCELKEAGYWSGSPLEVEGACVVPFTRDGAMHNGKQLWATVSVVDGTLSPDRVQNAIKTFEHAWDRRDNGARQ